MFAPERTLAIPPPGFVESKQVAKPGRDAVPEQSASEAVVDIRAMAHDGLTLREVRDHQLVPTPQRKGQAHNIAVNRAAKPNVFLPERDSRSHDSANGQFFQTKAGDPRHALQPLFVEPAELISETPENLKQPEVMLVPPAGNERSRPVTLVAIPVDPDATQGNPANKNIEPGPELLGQPVTPVAFSNARALRQSVARNASTTCESKQSPDCRVVSCNECGDPATDIILLRATEPRATPAQQAAHELDLQALSSGEFTGTSAALSETLVVTTTQSDAMPGQTSEGSELPIVDANFSAPCVACGKMIPAELAHQRICTVCRDERSSKALRSEELARAVPPFASEPPLEPFKEEPAINSSEIPSSVASASAVESMTPPVANAFRPFPKADKQPKPFESPQELQQKSTNGKTEGGGNFGGGNSGPGALSTFPIVPNATTHELPAFGAFGGNVTPPAKKTEAKNLVAGTHKRDNSASTTNEPARDYSMPQPFHNDGRLVPPLPPRAGSQTPMRDTSVQKTGFSQPVEEETFRAMNVALCRSIDGFGSYEAFSNYEFAPAGRALIYCELENYLSTEFRDQSGSGVLTRLESRLRIVATDGSVVQDSAFPVVEDRSVVRREDFYIYLPLTLESLPAGEYELQVSITDVESGQSAAPPAVPFHVR